MKKDSVNLSIAKRRIRGEWKTNNKHFLIIKSIGLAFL